MTRGLKMFETPQKLIGFFKLKQYKPKKTGNIEQISETSNRCGLVLSVLNMLHLAQSRPWSPHSAGTLAH